MYDTLISGAKLAEQLDNPNYCVIDCRFTLTDPGAGERAYTAAHIPGARYAHLERDLSGPRATGKGRHPLPAPADFMKTLAGWGIAPDTQVVVYDDSFGAMAVRLWWMLRWVSHTRVALLDGGLPRWRKDGRPVEDNPVVPGVATRPIANVDANPTLRDELLADSRMVDTVRVQSDWRVIDARAEDRFAGEREPIDPVAGHIPGSINRNFEDNLADDGTWLSPETLRTEFQALLGDTPPEQVIHSCGSGVTACHNLFAMERAGLHGSRLYAGSWSEWITDPQRPVALGPA